MNTPKDPKAKWCKRCGGLHARRVACAVAVIKSAANGQPPRLRRVELLLKEAAENDGMVRV